MGHTVTLPEIEGNTPFRKVFVKFFDVISEITSNSDVVSVDNRSVNNKLFNACLEFYCFNCGYEVLSNNIADYIFEIDEAHIEKADEKLTEFLNGIGDLDMNPIKLFVAEITDNIKEHSIAQNGLLYYWCPKGKNVIDICIADNGISILGSYVQKNLYIDRIGDSDAKAIALAKDGYSTKNLPDAENRGYGISKNINMITNGLNGSMYILSGSALMICNKGSKRILSMPEQTEWSGTLVFAEIPLKTPERFNIYEYI
jgi:hypothetical protein